MFIRKISKLLFVTALVLAVCAPVCFAQEKPGELTVLTVGDEKISELELVQIMESEGIENVIFMLPQFTLEQRRRIVSDMADAMLFAEGAKDEGLQRRPEIAARIKWQTSQILIAAYFEEVYSKWDFSDAAIEKYYNDHLADFERDKALLVSQILTADESEAIMATLESRSTDGFRNFAQIVERYSIDENSARNGGSLGWVQKGMLLSAVEEAVMNAQAGDIVGPVQSEDGWHVLRIESVQSGGLLPLEEVGNDVLGALETDYLEREFAELRKKHSVEINDDVLRTLGGSVAPETAPVK